MQPRSGKLRYSASSRAPDAEAQSRTESLPLRSSASCDCSGQPSASRASPDEQRWKQFGQFQSLQVAVPPESRLVCLTDNESLAAEKFRFLGSRLQHLRRERQLKKVLITSTIPQEGKSMVSANLACTLARRTQQRTLLVEGDVRRPSLSQMFGLERIRASVNACKASAI